MEIFTVGDFKLQIAINCPVG